MECKYRVKNESLEAEKRRLNLGILPKNEIFMFKNKYTNSLLAIFTIFFIGFPSHAQTFYNTFGLSSNIEGGTAITVDQNKCIYVGGTSNDSCLIFKLDSSGSIVLWAKKFLLAPSGRNHIKQLLITPDNFLVGISQIACPGQAFCGAGYFKFDLNGNEIWNKTFTNPNNFSIERILTESADRYILVSMDYQITGNYSDWKFFKINASDGQIASQTGRIDETHDGLASYYDDIYSSTQIKNNAFYFCGRVYTNGPSSNQMRPNVVKMDTSFNVLWSKFYYKPSSESAQIYPDDIKEYDDTLVIVYEGSKNSGSQPFSCGILKLDANGNVLLQKDLDIQGTIRDHPSSISVLPDGYLIYGCTNLTTSSPKYLFAIKTDRNANVIWAKQFGDPGLDNEIFYETFSAGEVKNNYLYFTAESNASYGKVIVGRMDLNGNINCSPTNNLQVDVSTIPNYEQTNLVRTETLDTINSNLISTISSEFLSGCGSIELGRDTIFCTAFNYAIQGPIVPNSHYLWNTGDTTASITVQDSGLYTLKLTIECCNYYDSVYIGRSFAQVKQQQIILCSGDSLKVGSRYYKTPGFYTDSLTSNDGCDSIVKTNLALYPIQFTISRNICFGDSIPFNNTFLTQQGSYHDTLVSFLGCDSIITLNLTTEFNTIPNFTLGNDTSFCSAFTMNLNAPIVTNASYLWSSGSTNPSIQVQDTGTFFVSVLTNCFIKSDTIKISKNNFQFVTQTINACEGDTIRIGNNQYTASGTYLDSIVNIAGCDAIQETILTFMPIKFIIDSLLCEGDSIYFNNQIIKNSGIFFSQQQSQIGCDSIIELRVVFENLPQLTIFGDTVICEGSSTILSANGAQSYLWSPSIGLNTTIQNNVIASPKTSVLYTLTGASGICSAKKEIFLEVRPNPTTQISYSKEPCKLEYYFSSKSSLESNILWNFGDGTLSNLASPVHNYNFPGIYNINIKLTGENSCALDSSFTLWAFESAGFNKKELANFFTPNDDGVNDIFYFTPYYSCNFIEFEIFDVIGRPIYKSNDIKKGWNGSNSIGAPCLIGTYIFRLVGQEKSYSGVINLIKN